MKQVTRFSPDGLPLLSFPSLPALPLSFFLSLQKAPLGCLPPLHARLPCEAEPAQPREAFLGVQTSVAESASETAVQKIILSRAVQHLLNLYPTFFALS